MLYKTSQRIENAWKRGQTVNVKVDDFGNTITNDDDEDGSEDEDFLAESLCEPSKMLYMLKLMFAFHAWYKQGHPFCLETPTYKKKFPVLSKLCCINHGECTKG